MKLWVYVVFILLFFTSPCTAYTLKSGVYIMSINLESQDKSMPQRVLVNVHNGKVTITNKNKEGEFKGKLEKNKIFVSSHQSDAQFEFKGKLVADNRVEGIAVQLSKNKKEYQATFTLVKAK